MKLLTLASLCLALVSGCVTTSSQNQQCCDKAKTGQCCQAKTKTCPMTKKTAQCSTCPTTKPQ